MDVWLGQTTWSNHSLLTRDDSATLASGADRPIDPEASPRELPNEWKRRAKRITHGIVDGIMRI
jgi:hypothetical protein